MYSGRRDTVAKLGVVVLFKDNVCWILFFDGIEDGAPGVFFGGGGERVCGMRTDL